MNVEWSHTQCIVCLTSGKLTHEHVIPKSVGGILTCKFLCISCNSKFGHGFEEKARLAPEIRSAANKKREIIPKLFETLELGAVYVSQFDEHQSTHKLRKDGQLATTRLNDGSIIVPETEAPSHIMSIMRKSGADDTECKEAIAAWKAAPPSTDVDLGANLIVRKWHNHPSTAAYTEASLNPLVPLKIVYEFSALLVGGAIYSSAFQPVRDILLEQNSVLAQEMVSYNWAAKPEPFHGIAFQGNTAVAQFQVRLFGLLAYTVRFPKIAIEHPRIAYTQPLDTNSDSVCVLDNNE